MSSKTSPRPKPEIWRLRLYMRSSVPQHQEFLGTLKAVCKAEGLGKGALEVVDVESSLSEVEREAIIALPLVVRLSPPPIRRIIGGAQPEALRQSLGISRPAPAERRSSAAL